ncbi:MAG: hypothetical protein EOP51_26460, partial [Sphingobacteriales bacterium]
MWTGATDNGSAATFTLNTTALQFHTGAKAMKIAVTNRGTNNSVKFTHSGFTASSARTYLLRFWAIADNNNALLNINIKSTAGDNGSSYKISKRFDPAGNGWQAYEYAFKTIDGPVSLEFTFNTNTTYYLDDVEIFDDTHPNIDVATQYKWQYNHPNPGWISGDNDTSVKLPDGSVAWIFSDSFMGTNDPHTNIMGSNRIINNLIVREKDEQFSYIIRGTPGNSGSLFNPNNGNIFWNDGGVVEDDKLKVVLTEVGGNAGNHDDRQWLGTLSLPGLTVDGNAVLLPHHVSCLLQEGEYTYVYYGESIGTFERYTKIARVKKGQLTTGSAWEFYTNANTWSKTETNTKRFTPGAVGSHVTKLGTGSYVMNAVPNLSSQIVVWFAPSPEGPWINRTVVYYTPEREAVLSYFGHMDAGSGKDGVYTFTYSSYPFIDDPIAMQVADKGVYTIHYAKANLLKLSPFTPKTDLGIASFNGGSVGKNIELRWTTIAGGYDHFEVEESRDLAAWTQVAYISGNAGKAYETQFPNPAEGIVFYRIKLFDADKNLVTTNAVKVVIKPGAALNYFAAVQDGSRVKLNFSTASEAVNPNFTVAKSTVLSADVSNWSLVANVEGAGTKSTTSNYEAY